MGLGKKCVANLLEGFTEKDISEIEEVDEIDLSWVVLEVLEDDHTFPYAEIGKVTLNKEIAELTRIIKAAGLEVEGKPGVEDKTEDDSVVAGVFKEMKANIEKAKDETDKKKKANSIWTSLTAANEYAKKVIKDNLNSENTEFVSFGAEGLKGPLNPAKFIAYKVKYPKIIGFSKNAEDNKKKAVALISGLANCNLIDNGLFCFASSRKLYEATLKNALGCEYDKKSKEWILPGATSGESLNAHR